MTPKTPRTVKGNHLLTSNRTVIKEYYKLTEEDRLKEALPNLKEGQIVKNRIGEFYKITQTPTKNKLGHCELVKTHIKYPEDEAITRDKYNFWEDGYRTPQSNTPFATHPEDIVEIVSIKEYPELYL